MLTMLKEQDGVSLWQSVGEWSGRTSHVEFGFYCEREEKPLKILNRKIK